MFDVGFWELSLIGVIGLLVLGPERLPRVARVAGGYLRKARQTWANVRSEISRELAAEELKSAMKEPVDDLRAAMRQPAEDLAKLERDVRQPVVEEGSAEASGKAGEGADNAAPDAEQEAEPGDEMRPLDTDPAARP